MSVPPLTAATDDLFAARDAITSAEFRLSQARVQATMAEQALTAIVAETLLDGLSDKEFDIDSVLDTPFTLEVSIGTDNLVQIGFIYITPQRNGTIKYQAELSDESGQATVNTDSIRVLSILLRSYA